jgi:hypothetical protein
VIIEELVEIRMTPQEFEIKFDNDDLLEQYATYILKHKDPEIYPVCNGNALLKLMEKGYLFEEFKLFMTSE